MRELESVEAFDRHVQEHGTLAGAALQGIDLTERSAPLLDLPVTGAVFLGCVVTAPVLHRLHADGGLVFPPFPELPFRAFRTGLYRPTELFDSFDAERDGSLQDCLDTRVYQWHRRSLEAGGVVDELAQRIHDHAIEDALAELLAEDGRHQRCVAIMGGHGMSRDEASYATVADLARRLTRAGFLCASGGGPGAMEATNLGAWFAAYPDEALDEALEVLAASPSYLPEHGWLATAFEVRRRWPAPEPDAVVSLGIPTWHYGHEPPNVFASHVAKYFANSIREDGLLAIALAGVVFAPGSAGTIQEVFQDAAQNHYSSFGRVSPMVFLDTHYWTETKPVYPLLAQLAEGHDYGRLLTIEDDPATIVDHLATSPTT